MIRAGLDVFLDRPDLTGERGLLSNVASLTGDGRTAYAALRAAGVNVTALFAPEHGYFGLGAAGDAMPDAQLDSAGRVPIYSLYGPTRESSLEKLRTLAGLLIDLQDTGARWYTYLWTIRNAIQACAAHGIPALVLDRPNPVGGLAAEGWIAERGFQSSVVPGAMPARYGLTIGEAARWLNRELGADLRVIRMDGWQRRMFYAETGLPWCAPSPNMPHAHTALVYLGTCLIEGTNLSEGRGTALPFEQFGAPFIQAEPFADRLNALALPGVSFTPCWFQPTVSKHAGTRCEGARVHLTEPGALRGYAMGLHIIAALRKLYPNDFSWVNWGAHNAFESLTATAQIRHWLEAERPVTDIIADCDAQAAAFHAHSWDSWLYD